MRYLIVANRTLGGEELLGIIRGYADEKGSHFFILVPASLPRGGMTWTESEVAMIARDRLERALARLSELGARVDGRVGDADPFTAVDDLLREHDFDEVIVCSVQSASRPRKTDLAGRVAEAFQVPVTRVTTAAEPATSVDALKRVPLFASLPTRRLRALARASVLREYRDGEPIVRAGTSGSDLYVILDGRVDVVLGGQRVAGLGAGEIFGEVSLLDPGPRTADVAADGPTRCVHLSGADFADLLEADPRLAISMLQVLARRLRRLTRLPAG